MEVHHPGLRSILDSLRSGKSLSAGELQDLERQLDLMKGRDASPCTEPQRHLRLVQAATPVVTGTLDGAADRKGTDQFAASFSEHAVGFYNEAQGLRLSSVGIGTYRGAMDDETDAAYFSAVRAALRAGVNVIDTSLNYRHQRSERSVGAALRAFVAQDGGSRNGVLVCTKGGYLVPGALSRELLREGEIAGDAHCMAPEFLMDQLERSRRNLGLTRVDVYYLHNPETQLRFIDASTFGVRIRRAFERLEQAASEGLISHYGIATWDGFFDGSLSLKSLEATARQIGGEAHRFRFVQLPVNLGMLDELRSLADSDRGVLDIARDLDITVMASASLLQGRSTAGLPGWITHALPHLATDAQRALQFVRSTPGVTCALTGMRDTRHVADNTALALSPPLSPKQYRAAFHQ
ncbi:aldo/keto reductase [Streptomyces sp. NPDC007808]|uniref:aldo/keto reductase n=1 Tax=Streptomyces sp. NPDC007808 TaxID=3364779 RepID=UPI0036BB58D2